MPFIVDLPPPSLSEKAKTEFIHFTNQTKDGLNNGNDELIYKLDSNLTKELFLQDKFDSLVEAWKENTWFESNSDRIIEDENFQEILNLGKQAIPLIIKNIDENPSHLVWALNIITGMHIKSPVRMNVTQSCKKWVELHKKGLLKFK
ncbi:hypothetical protein [Flagellimonas olearia]|uniref:Uncharacterized protein n=1 Tax=Flagellimonas olearia TaxID=552546 RepID=A0A444VI46_9FLAO|nr:hypothetical protein [Allomuricauda olearia]RYC50438.1 hypothetical protein DN53_05845 [Allomuricauda olearia]